MYPISFITLLIVCQSAYSVCVFLEINSENHVPSITSQSIDQANSVTNNLTSSFSSGFFDTQSSALTLTSTRSKTLVNNLSSDLIRAIDLDSLKFESIYKTQPRSRFKDYVNRKYSRRRRSSIYYSSKKVDKQRDDLIPLSHKFTPTELHKKNNDLMNLLKSKNLSRALNNTKYFQFENYTDYNGTSTIYVELPPSLKVFFYCVYTLIFFVGLIGNSLNIYVVYSNKNMYNVTYFFITNLAMSDILLCLFSVPITPMYLLLYKHWPFENEFGKLLCHLLPFSQGVSVYVSAFTLMSIAVDRYFVIIFPFKKRMSVRMCVCIIIIIWISGSTLTLPYAIFMKLIEVDDESGGYDGKKIRFCEEAWPHEASRRTFSTCTSVIQFVVPFVIIAFCYSKVCSKLKTRAKLKPGAKSARKEELERERSRRTNRMLIAMVIIFGLAWLPLNVHNLVVDFYESANNWPYIRCFFLLAHAIAMSCTCYNFCLYAYLNDHFRKNFKAVLPCFDVPFFQRMRNDGQTNQTNNALNIGLKSPNVCQLNTTSSLPLGRELLTKTEPSTKQIILTEDDQNDLSNIEKLPDKQNYSMCSEPATIYFDNKTDVTKCPCSTSYPNFQLKNDITGEQQVSQDLSSSSSNKLIKSLRSKLRFSGESSLDEQSIALNDYSSKETNNNNSIRSSDQKSPVNSAAHSATSAVCSVPSKVPQNNLAGTINVPNNGKCNTIYLSGLNDKNLAIQMDNV